MPVRLQKRLQRLHLIPLIRNNQQIGHRLLLYRLLTFINACRSGVSLFINSLGGV